MACRSGVEAVLAVRSSYVRTSPVRNGGLAPCPGPPRAPDEGRAAAARLAFVRVRQFELRLVAVALTLLWAMGGAIALVAYRPGGPVDVLVGVAASLPLLLGLAAAVWPPLVRSVRASAVVFWIGFVAALLLIPAIFGVATQVLAGTAEPLLPSLELVYPFVLALVATSLFAGLGVSRRLLGETGTGRRRIALTVAFSVVTCVAIGGTFTGVSLADDAALSNRPAAHSRFGPTQASPAPPSCDGSLSIGSTATLELTLTGNVDGRTIGNATLDGVRSGSNVAWTAQVVRADLFGNYGSVRIGSQAWTLAPGRGWTAAPPVSVDNELVDATLYEIALTPGNRSTAEDLGLDYVEGARARHCRVAVDGDQFVDAFPQTRWLIGSANPSAWRGEIDYWVFGDGELGMATGSVNGDAQGILPGLQATIQASLTATNRGQPVTIAPPP